MASMVFISHSHADRELAEALVEFLLASLEIAPNNVRCTSVPGHQLAFGRTIAEQLKADINTSSAVMVLLTKTSMGSKWVMFELGASWALGKVVVPILGTSLTIDILPGPLSAYPSVATDSPEASSLVADAIAQIGLQLGLKERTGGKRDYKLQIFLEVARRDKSTRPPPD